LICRAWCAARSKRAQLCATQRNERLRHEARAQRVAPSHLILFTRAYETMPICDANPAGYKRVTRCTSVVARNGGTAKMCKTRYAQRVRTAFVLSRKESKMHRRRTRDPPASEITSVTPRCLMRARGTQRGARRAALPRGAQRRVAQCYAAKPTPQRARDYVRRRV